MTNEFSCDFLTLLPVAPRTELGWDRKNRKGPLGFSNKEDTRLLYIESFQGPRDFFLSLFLFFLFYFLIVCPSVGLMHRQLHLGLNINILNVRGL